MNPNPPGYHPPNQPPLTGQPPGFGPGVTLGAKTSPLALWSMILGLATLPLVFLCLGLVTGLVAIILGILGLVAVSKGQGRVKGKGMALTGIISAITAYGIYAVFISNIAKNQKEIPAGEFSQRSALSSAESQVISSRDGTAYGNDAEAREIAAEFASTMKTMHSAFFEREGNASKVSLTKGEFVTFCQLSDAGCAFIVHVPDYRKHTGDAKESLSELAWMVASTVAARHPETIPTGTPLGVGLKGSIIYGAILTGQVGDEDPTAHSSTDKEALYSFFELPEVEEEPDPDPVVIETTEEKQ